MHNIVLPSAPTRRMAEELNTPFLTEKGPCKKFSTEARLLPDLHAQERPARSNIPSVMPVLCLEGRPSKQMLGEDRKTREAREHGRD